MKFNSIILNIPHASAKIPENTQFLLDKDIINREVYMLADLYTDEMIELKPFIKPVKAKVSRIVVDTERFTDDRQEEASRYGMGVIYTKTHDGYSLKNVPTSIEREQLLQKWYYPHHQILNKYVENELKKHRQALIIDLHSYPTSFDMLGIKNKLTPDICIGFEEYHCHKVILDKIINWCKQHNYTYALNNPFSGAIVPLQYYKKDKRVISFMLEIRRSLYMDEYNFNKNNHFPKLQNNLNQLAQMLIS